MRLKLQGAADDQRHGDRTGIHDQNMLKSKD